MTQERNLAPRSRPGRSRRVHGWTVWEQARTEYLSGDSARRVCKRHGLNLSTFYDRAKRDGWRRLDVLEDRVWTAGDERALDQSYGSMEAQAWRHAARAIARGSRAEARSWLLVARDLERHCLRDMEVEEVEPQPPTAAPAFRSFRPDDSDSYGLCPKAEITDPSTACLDFSDHTEKSADASVSAPPTPRSTEARIEPAAPPELDQVRQEPAGTAGIEPPDTPAAGQPTLEPRSVSSPDTPAAPPPWATLLARPEDDTTGAERAARFFAGRLSALYARDPAEALRRWAEHVRRLDIDPERPPAPPPAPRRPRPQFTGFRVITP